MHSDQYIFYIQNITPFFRGSKLFTSFTINSYHMKVQCPFLSTFKSSMHTSAGLVEGRLGCTLRKMFTHKCEVNASL